MVLETPQAIYFYVGDGLSGTFGHCWRMGTSNVSFYVKPRLAALAGFKISLHGPQPPKHPAWGFKFGMDKAAMPKANAAGGALVYNGSRGLPEWFTGRQVLDGTSHVMTYRVTWELFEPGIPSAPRPAEVRAETGFAIPPPSRFRVADVEVYVSEQEPYWPNVDQSRRDDACLPAIRNKRGQYLTALSVQRSVFAPEGPPSELATELQRGPDSVRGLGAQIGDDGVLWVVERLMAKSMFTEAIAG